MIQCIELFGANATEIFSVKNGLKGLRGDVDVLIHPFYSKETTPTPNNRYVKSEYLKKRDNFVRDCFSRKIPLIIFQQEKDYLELAPKLEPLGKGIVYTVKTEMGQHYPTGGDKNWHKFIKILNSYKINHVKLGGMYLVNYRVKDAVRLLDPKYDTRNTVMTYVTNIPAYINKYSNAGKWIEKDIVPEGCVGFAAMEFLNSGIDVTLTTLTTPCSGTDYITD